MAAARYDLPPELSHQKREADELKKAVCTAQDFIRDAKLRYMKDKLRARSKQVIADQKFFAELDGYDRKDDIHDAYGWEWITEKQMDRLMELWDLREQYMDQAGRYSDPVTKVLDHAIATCGGIYAEQVESFEEMEREYQAEMKRIEKENRDNAYNRSQGLML